MIDRYRKSSGHTIIKSSLSLRIEIPKNKKLTDLSVSPEMPVPDVHAVKLLPHPHPPVAFGLLKVNPEPCMDEV